MTRYLIHLVFCCACILLISSTILIQPGAALSLGSAGTATTEMSTIANGDTVTLQGIATGHPRNGLQVWVIGNNYLKISSVMVNDDNTFSFELKSADTLNLAPGQYFVVVQHPMMNGQFDVYYDASSGSVINRQLGNDGLKIYQMSGSGSLQGPDSAQALVNAISSQNIDDSFTTYTFFISPPTALINPIGEHYVGDRFTISGSTNLAVGDNLMVEVTSSSFKPTQKVQGSEFSGASGVVTVVPGSSGYNHWSFDVDATSFKPDEYIVKVSGITQDVTGSTYFTIVSGMAATPVSTIASPTATISTSATTTNPVPSATIPNQSPLSLGIVMSALGILVLVKTGRRT
jgi:trimeric autotransporter adhesin